SGGPEFPSIRYCALRDREGFRKEPARLLMSDPGRHVLCGFRNLRSKTEVQRPMDHEHRADSSETNRGATQARNVDTTPPTKEVREVDTASRRDYRPPRANIGRTESVAYDQYESQRMIGYRLTQLVYWIFGLIEGLIAIRFVLKALGANPTAGFAQ